MAISRSDIGLVLVLLSDPPGWESGEYLCRLTELTELVESLVGGLL